MFAPDIWTFPVPNTHITSKYSESNSKCLLSASKRIHSHPFNQSICIILPDEKEVPDDLQALLKDSDHYQVDDFPLAKLVEKPFVEAFVKSGQFYGSSVGTRIDIDDCVCVTPEGQLHLSLTKDVYYHLGLEGKLSSFGKKYKDRYLIRIDLKALLSQTKYHARVKNALSNEILPKFSLRFIWQPPQPTRKSASTVICPSSVAKYFSDQGCDVKLVQTECKLKIEYGLEIPRLGGDTDDPVEIEGRSDFYATPHELTEYAGILALSCDRQSSEYLNSWRSKGHTIEVGYALVIRLKGMFSCDLVRMIFKNLRQHADAKPLIPWVSMYVHGDPNAPVSFSNAEHSVTHNGDNSYAIFLASDHKYLFYEILSSNKALK